MTLPTNLSRSLPPNTFISVPCLEITLALFAAGAEGKTLNEMRTCFGWPLDDDERHWTVRLSERLNDLAKSLALEQEQSLQGRAVDPVDVHGHPQILASNQIFSRVSIRHEYASAAKTKLFPPLSCPKLLDLESAEQINDFIVRETEGAVSGPDLVSNNEVAASTVVVASVVSFQGRWAAPFFSRSDTVITPFRDGGVGGLRVCDCHLMRTKDGGEWLYHEDLFGKYVLLPYQGTGGSTSVTGLTFGGGDEKYAALIALPNLSVSGDGGPLGKNPMGELDPEVALRIMTSATSPLPKRTGTLWMPRFRVGFDDVNKKPIDLVAALRNVGIWRAFDDAAEFANVAGDSWPPFKITNILQKVLFSTDEEGTVATDSQGPTAVAPSPGSVPVPVLPQHCRRPPFEMRCDRPFAFCIVHLPSTTMVLSGNIVGPGEIAVPVSVQSRLPLSSSISAPQQSVTIISPPIHARSKTVPTDPVAFQAYPTSPGMARPVAPMTAASSPKVSAPVVPVVPTCFQASPSVATKSSSMPLPTIATSAHSTSMRTDLQAQTSLTTLTTPTTQTWVANAGQVQSSRSMYSPASSTKASVVGVSNVGNVPKQSEVVPSGSIPHVPYPTVAHTHAHTTKRAMLTPAVASVEVTTLHTTTSDDVGVHNSQVSSIPLPLPCPRMTKEQRAREEVLFTPSCRRDIYRVLCSEPRRGLVEQYRMPPPQPTTPPNKHPPLKWVIRDLKFVRRGRDRTGTEFGSSSASDATDTADVVNTLAMIPHIGRATKDGMAVSESFEDLLAREYVPWWSDEDGASLSAAFTAAFGAELTPRLDINHALRSRRFHPSEVVWLRSLHGIDRNLLDTYQE